MAKTSKQTDDTDEESENRATLYPITLTMGKWREGFTQEQRKLIIAEALNYCTYNHGLNIAGYLINNTRLHLVLKINKADIHRMLNLFYDSVGREVSKYRSTIKHIDFETAEKQLFIRHSTVNDSLVRLITGKQVDLGYYDPQLARLKDNINSSDFCSAIDYTGAIGPVIVKLPAGN
ncbi:hypothetical protein [Mucilaginibacter sp. L196]|uniref:hypothetical protein n=1 Tax=Mucilaginibacter sp. L196 TaxID=1641870 RepID=UPI00131E73C4|nr:hypothetical protein [Mucilaginibacter sp. L196]